MGDYRERWIFLFLPIYDYNILSYRWLECAHIKECLEWMGFNEPFESWELVEFLDTKRKNDE